MSVYERLNSVADIPRLYAKERPGAVALDFKDRLTTYGELDARSNRVAQGLIGLGQKPGARVGYLGKNSDRYFEVLFGAFKARAVIVGVNWRLAPPEIAYVLNDAGCEVLFVGKDYYGAVEKIRELCPKLEHVIAIDGGHNLWPGYEPWRDAHNAKDPMLPVAPDDDVIQLYTSGTTGHPKGVQLTSANYLAIIKSATDMGLATYTPEDVVLIAMPIFHVAGVNIGVLTLSHGARGIVLGDIDPQEILSLIETKRINHAFLVPAVILFLTQQPNVRQTDFSSLKIISYGASPIAQDLLLSAKEIMGCDFLQVYGLTETTGGATVLPPEDHDPARGKLRSCGRPAPGHEIRVVDSSGRALPPHAVGEIVIRAPNVMKGYWNRAEATAKSILEEWFYTGDAGLFRRGWLPLHPRPGEGHDRVGRREYLSRRGGKRPFRPSRRRRRGRDRRARRALGRGGEGRGGAKTGCRAPTRRASSPGRGTASRASNCPNRSISSRPCPATPPARFLGGNCENPIGKDAIDR